MSVYVGCGQKTTTFQGAINCRAVLCFFTFFTNKSYICIYIYDIEYLHTECVKVPTRCLLITCRTNLYNFAALPPAQPKQQVFVPSLKQGMYRLPYYLHYTMLNEWNPTMMVSKRKPCHFPCQTLGGKLGGWTTHLKKYALQNGSLFCRSGFKIIFETTPLRNANRWFYNPVTSRLTKDIPGYLFNMNLPFMVSDKVFGGTN